MALSLLSHEVSDLCIGKPAIRLLPPSATVADALLELRLCGEPYIGACCSLKDRSPAGRICLVDVLCFICTGENVASPAAALASPAYKLLLKGSTAAVRVLDPHASILDALDAVIDGGAHSLAVPILSPRKKLVAGDQYCWLTQEDLVRFFFSSIAAFSPLPALSVSDLGLVRPAGELAVRLRDPAITAVVPLLLRALAESTSVAVVSDDEALLGEISPSTLSALRDESIAPAIAALSAGELMSYVDLLLGGAVPEVFAQTLRERLEEREMDGMLRLLDGSLELDLSTTTTTSGSSSSSSDDDDGEEGADDLAGRGRRRSGPRRSRSLGSYSARMGRSSEGAIVCRPSSSLVAVLVQALAHRVSYVWVVDDLFRLAGIVVFSDVLRVFRDNQPLL